MCIKIHIYKSPLQSKLLLVFCVQYKCSWILHMCGIIDRCACMTASVSQRGKVGGEAMINLTERPQFMIKPVSVLETDKVCLLMWVQDRVCNILNILHCKNVSPSQKNTPSIVWFIEPLIFHYNRAVGRRRGRKRNLFSGGCAGCFDRCGEYLQN